MTTFKGLRHGEILLHPIKTLKKGKESLHKSFIVGHSETGHHHVLESKQEFKVIERGTDSVLLELWGEAALVHKKQVDKHNTLKVAPGRYEVIYKTEYDPFSKLIRRVED